MRKLIKYTAAGVVALAGQGLAQAAQPVPSSGASDLWLFVADTATSTTFAEDTGISINSLMPAATLTGSTGAVLSAAITDTINLAPSAALTSFINSNGAANLTWTVEAGQYPNGTTKPYKAGNEVGITANNQVASQTSNINGGGMTTWLSAFNGDVSYLNGAYVAGGSSYAWASGSTGANVWGAGGTNAAGGSTNLYQQGADSSGSVVGTSEALYGITGNGNANQVQSFVLGQLTLGTDGTLSTGGGSPVPLPAAAWLLGSGLLGLAGIGRRRSVSVAA